MMKKIILAATLAIATISTQAQATDTTKKTDLFADIENESKQMDKSQTDYASATFKSTRVVNGHSTETIGKYNLDFRISHRFGFVNNGAYDFFGLDNATMRIGVDYGLTNNIMVGIGRSNDQKEFDALLKYKFLRQSKGKINMPVSVAYLFDMASYTQKETNEVSFKNRTSFANQLIIARKFSDNVSFQVSPTWVHVNMVDYKVEDNDLFSVGLAGRVKISKRVAINAEWYPQLNRLTNTTNSFSLGFDIETGGHVFQLHFTNSTGMNERRFITNTYGDWGKGDIRFGFNITRIFNLKKSAGSRSSW